VYLLAGCFGIEKEGLLRIARLSLL